jgi:hypothetical protein
MLSLVTRQRGHRAWVLVGLVMACGTSKLPRPDPSDAGPKDSGVENPGRDGGDAVVDAGFEQPVDGGPPQPVWSTGRVGTDLNSLPAYQGLFPLPGGGVGGPVVTSNNPEVFTSEGLLMTTSPAASVRGGAAYPLAGAFGVYFHHLNRRGTPTWVSVLLTNPNSNDVTVEVAGAAWTQDQTGNLALGNSPDYRVSEAWIGVAPKNVVVPRTTLGPSRSLTAYVGLLGQNREVDGRLGVVASAPVSVYVTASASADTTAALIAGGSAAAGDIRSPGSPPPPFGREAGVYAHDTWKASIPLKVPTAGRYVGYLVNTATGIPGVSQVQAFPALSRLPDSSAEAVGMYGNVYDITTTLVHDGDGSAPRRVRLIFASYGAGSPSRFWDGVGLVDGASVVLRHTPATRTQVLAEVEVAPGAPGRQVTFRAMVPGLASIPQALFVESY